MKYFPHILTVVVGFVFCGQLETALAAENDRKLPNIIYIMADDLGYAELGCYGQNWIKTPNIDRIAAEGIRFTQHYSGNAVCAPSRCALMTGKHMGHAYTRNNGGERSRPVDDDKSIFRGQYPIPDSEVTIAEVLKQKGYATGAMGKWGLGYERSTGDPNNQGFDLFYGYLGQRHAHSHYPRFLWNNGVKEWFPGNDRQLLGKTYSQDKFAEQALKFIDDHKDGPFFLYLPFAVPHLSIQVPEKSLAEYKGKIPEEEYKHRGYLKHPFPRAGYAAMVSHMDRHVGQIMDRIESLGLDDNTLIVFTSDNGPTYQRLGGSDSTFFESAGPMRGLKGSLYEGGIRVPMVARWPGQIKAGTTSDLVSAFWDVLPTLAELTGTTAPDNIDGISFAPTLLGQTEQQKEHQFLYWEFPAYGGQQAVRLGNWKGIRQEMSNKKNRDRLKIQLYDLSNDIGETTDVAEAHPQVVAKIRELMKAEHTPSQLFPLSPLD